MENLYEMSRDNNVSLNSISILNDYKRIYNIRHNKFPISKMCRRLYGLSKYINHHELRAKGIRIMRKEHSGLHIYSLFKKQMREMYGERWIKK